MLRIAIAEDDGTEDATPVTGLHAAWRWWASATSRMECRGHKYPPDSGSHDNLNGSLGRTGAYSSVLQTPPDGSRRLQTAPVISNMLNVTVA